MKRLFDGVSVLLFVMLFSASPFAQWPAYPTPGVPRTAAGQPILDAATPRTADGKPALSGNWVRFRGEGGGTGTTPPPAQPPGTPPLATFFDVGAGFPEGLPFQPWAAELKKARNDANSKDNPDAHCLPMGFMQFHLHPQPRKIIQTPGLTVIIYEANYGLRYIYTDGRALPPNGSPQPWWH